MTTIHHHGDGDAGLLAGAPVAVVGYGNQGRFWALNLRDSGLDVTVCARADETRDPAGDEGLATAPISAANDAEVICVGPLVAEFEADLRHRLGPGAAPLRTPTSSSPPHPHGNCGQK